MNLQWTTFSLLLAVATVTMPRVAAAQPVAPPSSTAPLGSAQRAKAHFEEGVRLFDINEFAKAETELEAAWALKPTGAVAFNLGNAEYWQGKYREAAEHYSFARRDWPKALAALRPEVEQQLAVSRTHVGALTVNVNVAGAEVLVNGASVGKAPLRGEVFVESGTHTVEAKLKGYVSAKEKVVIAKGAAMPVNLRLVAAPVKVAEDRRGEGGPNKGVIITGFASSAVAVTGGVVFAIVSNVKAADADAQTAALRQKGGERPCGNATFLAECVEIDRKIRLSDTFGNLSFWSFVGGGILGAGTVIYTLAAPKSEAPTTARVLPVAAHRGGGLVLVGEW